MTVAAIPELPALLTCVLLVLLGAGCAGDLDDVDADSAVALQHADDAVSFIVLGDWGRRGRYYQDDVAEQMAAVAGRTDAPPATTSTRAA